MLDAYVEAGSNLLSLGPLLALVVGVGIGLINGALPAGGSIPVLVILMGFAYGMDPSVAIALVIGALAVNGTTDAIPCVLLGIPGAASAQATILDGHTLARQGRAGYALSAAYASSLIGGLVGAVALTLFIPLARSLLSSFGSAEFFLMALAGVAIIGVVSSGAVIKGLLAATLGLGIALVGYDPLTGVERGAVIEYLWDGIPLIPAIIGLFALPEILDLVVSDQPVSRSSTHLDHVRRDLKSQRGEGIRAALNAKLLVFRASVIGLLVGIVPGLGGSVAHWLAYAQARETEKGARESFGTGDIRGVIAPESANNSIDAGVLMPTVAFGIPGSGHMALFLGFLTLLGLEAGPPMLNQHLDLTLLMVWSLALANIMATAVALYFTPLLARITLLPPNVIAPVVMGLLFISAFQSTRSMGDLVVVCVLFVVGSVMKLNSWPRIPIVLGLVLAAPLEKYMWLSVNTYGWEMLARPQVWIFMALAVTSVVFSVRGRRSAGGTGAVREVSRAAVDTTAGQSTAASSEGVDIAGLLEAIFVTLLAALFLYFLSASTEWPTAAALMPKAVSCVGLILLLGYLLQRFGGFGRPGEVPGRMMDIGFRDTGVKRSALTRRVLRFGASVGGIVGGIWLLGFHLTIPLFVFVYLTRYGKVRWYGALAAAGFFVLLLVGVYDTLVEVPWNEPVLLRVLGFR